MMSNHSFTLSKKGVIFRRGLVGVWSVVLLAGCATYHPVALETSAKLSDKLEQLHMDTSQRMELPKAWRNSSVNVDDGLNEIEIIQLAVLNSPHMDAVRALLPEASAQLMQAGLLPDPQLNLSADFPSSKDPALVKAYGIGLGFDLQALIIRGSKKSAATKQARATYLRVLWQEWQIIQQARILYRRGLIQDQKVGITHAQFLQAQQTWLGEKNALSQGNVTLAQEGLPRAAMMDAHVAWVEARRQRSATAHDLALLLGLNPHTLISLVGPSGGLESLLVAPPAQGKAWKIQLDTIATRRPDLLALQAGYMSQESKVREQILRQFPTFSIGANRLRDTAGLWSLGPFINLNLPVFNGNRGNISMARATRGRLMAEYRDQRVSAYVQASRLADDQRLAYEEWEALVVQVPDLQLLTQRMANAMRAGDVDMLTFTTIRSNYYGQQARLLNLEQVLLEQSVALDTLMGTLPRGHLSKQGSGFPSQVKQAAEEIHP